ncbi:alpha/beta fold hydrolase [Alteromonas sp. CYL-A6]|uniref:alpha/beta fold hydrolase n=1 Tax=Alteromonas nitratireducens TaxID=3390813 RepID=UPI0034C3DF00
MEAFCGQLTTPRGRFFIRDSGGEGIPVLLIHGWPQSSMCWEETLAHLPATWRYIRPDTRGMGDSERTFDVADYAKTELANDMLAIIDTLGIDRFIVVGHDWGGIIAQEVALASPERVIGLALLNISLINNPVGQAKAREALTQRGGIRFLWYQFFQQQPELAEAMIPGNERVWLSHFLQLAKGRTLPSAMFDEYVRTFSIPGTATTSANYYRAMQFDMPRWAMLDTPYAMPGLLIYGEKDVVIIPEYFDDIESSFPRGVEQVRLSAGHFVQDELPADVASALLTFFVSLTDAIS